MADTKAPTTADVRALIEQNCASLARARELALDGEGYAGAILRAEIDSLLAHALPIAEERDRLAAEVARLTDCLARANAGFEAHERTAYLNADDRDEAIARADRLDELLNALGAKEADRG